MTLTENWPMYFAYLFLLGGMVVRDCLESHGSIFNDKVFMTIISETLRFGITTYLLYYV